jgi:redox-sensitive bicupin YhaK (pirin superfamily)
MNTLRKTRRTTRSQPVIEGAGVHLKRAFGHGETPDFDPFLLISGKPIGEPVAWQGPIVMNTRAELELAFREYRDGAFIKHGAGSQQ